MIGAPPVFNHFFPTEKTLVMSKHILHFPIFLLATIALFFTACQKDDATAALTTEEYVDQALFLIQEEGNIGPFGCYELVFPVTLEMPDGTTITAAEYDELAEALRGWHEANPRLRHRDHRPQFVFPIEVFTEEGELVSVEDRADLKRLREACGSDEFGRRDRRGHRGNCEPCFHLVFPINIQFPDDTTTEVADRQELKQTIRQWRADNPGVDERPQIVFPINVEMNETGEIVTVNNREELKELRESCVD